MVSLCVLIVVIVISYVRTRVCVCVRKALLSSCTVSRSMIFQCILSFFFIQYSTVLELILKSVERWRTVDMVTAPTCKYTRSIPWRHLFHDFFSETGMYLYARTYTTNDRKIFLVRRRWSAQPSFVQMSKRNNPCALDEPFPRPLALGEQRRCSATVVSTNPRVTPLSAKRDFW